MRSVSGSQPFGLEGVGVPIYIAMPGSVLASDRYPRDQIDTLVAISFPQVQQIRINLSAHSD